MDLQNGLSSRGPQRQALAAEDIALVAIQMNCFVVPPGGTSVTQYRTVRPAIIGGVIPARRPWFLIVILLLSGVAGLWAAFQLTLNKFEVLANPDAQLGCNYSLLVQCGKNLQSPQGAVFFGVPNPVWGDIGWGVVLAIAMSLVAGAAFQRWFWICANIGVAGALVLCIWLMSQSIFVLGTLCP